MGIGLYFKNTRLSVTSDISFDVTEIFMQSQTCAIMIFACGF